MVPSRSAVSGMTLSVVPASILAIVTTAGSAIGTRRVTIVCSAVTISQAIGTGSSASCGIEAWPPRPLTVIAELVGRGEQRAGAAGERRRAARWAMTCSAKAASGSGIEQAVLEHEAGAVMALLARLEHEHAPCRRAVAAGAEQPGGAGQHRDVACRGRRRASRRRTVEAKVEAGVLGHRQGVHVAAQQDRAAVAGAPRRMATRPVVEGPSRNSSGRPASAAFTLAVVRGQCEAELGLGVDGAAQRDHLGEEGFGVLGPVGGDEVHGARPFWRSGGMQMA